MTTATGTITGRADKWTACAYIMNGEREEYVECAWYETESGAKNRIEQMVVVLYGARVDWGECCRRQPDVSAWIQTARNQRAVFL